MIGELLARCLILVFGFAYPACRCFRAVEKKMDNEELRFWCQYWLEQPPFLLQWRPSLSPNGRIIVAILTVCERVADLAFSWLPVYEELKLGFVIYLWHSKTQGSRHIYETMLRPYVRGHETDIEQRLMSLKSRIWDVAVYYWQNCTELGQSAMFQVLDYLSAESGSFASSRIQQQEQAKTHRNSPLSRRQSSGVGMEKPPWSDHREEAHWQSYIFAEETPPREKPRQRNHWFFRRS